MTWAAVVTVGGSIISGIGASKKDKKDKEFASSESRLSDEREAKYNAVLAQFNKESDWYYRQLERKNKQRGLDQFRQFSTVNQFAPNFVGGNNTITLPEKPDAIAAVQKVSGSPTQQTQQPASSSGKKSSGLFGVVGNLLGF